MLVGITRGDPQILLDGILEFALGKGDLSQHEAGLGRRFSLGLPGHLLLQRPGGVPFSLVLQGHRQAIPSLLHLLEVRVVVQKRFVEFLTVRPLLLMARAVAGPVQGQAILRDLVIDQPGKQGQGLVELVLPEEALGQQISPGPGQTACREIAELGLQGGDGLIVLLARDCTSASLYCSFSRSSASLARARPMV